MGSILGHSAKTNSYKFPSSTIRVQTALAGKPIPIVYGQVRLAANLIWYGDFKASPVKGGGKAGHKGGGPGNKAGLSGQYQYSAYIALGLCEGPIQNVDFVWLPGTTTEPNGISIPDTAPLAQLNMNFFPGTYSQGGWGWTIVNDPSQALNYRGLAYITVSPAQMGSAPVIPNWQFETVSANAFSSYINGSQSGIPDVDPGAIISDFLSNPTYGCGFPAAFLDNTSLPYYRAMCIGLSMVMSDAIVNEVSANTYLQSILEATNSEFVWSGGLLRVIPYGDSGPIANVWVPGSGVISYVPQSAPIYSLTMDDFMKNSGTGTLGQAAYMSDDPVICVRKRRSDASNTIKVEYLDRGNWYNPTVIEMSDEAAVYTWGLRPKDQKSYHFFANSAGATQSALLLLHREQVLNQYMFTVDQRYMFLDPMDLIEITDPALGPNPIPVLIKEITENQQDQTLTFICEEYLGHTTAVPLYQQQNNVGYVPPWNALAGPVDFVEIWEPPYSLAGSYQVWIAASGNQNFGGAEVWVSQDNSSYVFLGLLPGPSNVGTLTTALPSVPATVPPPTLDQTNTLAVDFTLSGFEPLATNTTGVLNANTLCLIAGHDNPEYLAYRDVTFVSGETYDLSFLNRGLYGSVPGSHAAGDACIQLIPGSFLRMSLTTDRVGQVFYLKFLSRNAFGGGIQSLADADAYTYTTTGAASGGSSLPGGIALPTPPSDPTNLVTAIVGTQTFLTWIGIADTRPILYEVRVGSAFATGYVVAVTGGNMILVQGDGTYWVAARITTATGGFVYDANPPSITITGSVVISNLVKSWDEAITGWTGTLGGSATVSGSVVETSGTLPGSSGSYTIPASHIITLSEVQTCNVILKTSGGGAPIGQNFLSITDFLSVTDFLGFAIGQNVQLVPQIQVSQDGGVTWGAWQNYVGGAYTGSGFNARVLLNVLSPQAQAILEDFVFEVDAPGRIDHYNGVTIANGAGTVITFKPDGSSTAMAFNGGPKGSSVPAVQATVISGGTTALTAQLSSISLSSVTVQVLNATGTSVGGTVNVTAEGF